MGNCCFRHRSANGNGHRDHILYYPVSKKARTTQTGNDSGTGNICKRDTPLKNRDTRTNTQHIAAEIHDNFNPTLSVINLNLSSVLPQVQEPARETITDTKVLLRQLMFEMRALSSSLNAHQISHIGLNNALEKYIEQLGKTRIYQIEFCKTGKEYRLGDNKEIILLRMCQEILNNIVKHASAKKIAIHITYTENFHKIEISDDGVGFDQSIIDADITKSDSSGLRNLKSRALAIGAELLISSIPNKGTNITITTQSS